MIRLAAGHHASALVLLMVEVQVAILGLASGVVFRSPRPFELALVVTGYIGLQGHGPLAFTTSSPTFAASLTLVGVAIAALVVGWELVTSPRALPGFLAGSYRRK